MPRFLAALRTVPLALLAGLLALPVLALLAAWLPWGQVESSTAGILGEMATTVLPRYTWTTLWLGLWVAVGAAVVGSTTAAAVTLFEFPGRRALQWLLLLPLAVPAYVGAYALADFLDYSGPVQTALRETMGYGSARDYWFPQIRSLEAAVVVLAAALYPYVYLLARAAWLEQSASAYEAARALGTGGWGLLRRVVLPLARPAIVAGAAIVSALQEIVARNVDPAHAAVVSVTEFHAGSAYNVIPADALLRGTWRFLDPQDGARIEARIRDVCAGVALSR